MIGRFSFVSMKFINKEAQNSNQLIFLLILVGITTYIYFPGLSGGYYLDDFPNIAENESLHISKLDIPSLWQATMSGFSGPLGRPIPMLSFSLNLHFYGGGPFSMKVTNLIIHIIVGILIFLLIKLLLSYIRDRSHPNLNVNLIALVTSCAWLMHPINLTGVLYIVQRMTSLSALFILVALLFYIHARLKQQNNNGHWLYLFVGTGFFSLVALLCKENAILIIFYIACIELIVFRFNSHSSKDRKILKIFIAFIILVPITSAILFLALNPNWLQARYEFRTFNLFERLLTESRIVVWYLKMIVTPNLNEMSIFLDDIPISTSLFKPISTIFSSVFLLFLIAISCVVRRPYPIIALGIFWFFIGHLLESTIIPLELAYEHRNYLSSFGIILLIVFILERLSNNKKLRYLIFSLGICWLTAISYTTYLRSTHWSNPIKQALIDVEHRPNSVRANVQIAGIYSFMPPPDNPEEDKNIFFNLADHYFQRAMTLDNITSTADVARIIHYSYAGKKLPDDEFKSVVEKLSDRKIEITTLNALFRLTECQIHQKCKLPVNDYMAIMYAPLTQAEKQSSSALSKHLIYLSRFYAEYLGDIDTAIKLSKESIIAHPPHIEHRFALIKWLGVDKQYDEAIKELNLLKSLDTLGKHTATILEWEKLLETTATSLN